jgi:hypothetical protein
MKKLILTLLLIIHVFNAKSQSNKFQIETLETYVTFEAFFRDSATLKLNYEIKEANDHFIQIRKKYNTRTDKIDRNKYYGFKYKGKKYFNLFWSESKNEHLFVPLEMEGFFSLIVIPISKKDPNISNSNFPGGLASVILKNHMRSKWKDREGNKYYILILEPNIKGTAYANYRRFSDTDGYGVYISNVSRKRYNRKFGFNLLKRKTYLEDWKEVVNKLNGLHNSGKLDYTQEQKEAAREEKNRKNQKRF